MSQKETNNAYEERKKEFLYEINTKGKYHILKEKMKKTQQKYGEYQAMSKM